tara:strand:- start:478 stop:672 length:195 start_codon:yes stop_codon:yes gene_type:complete
MSLAWDDELLQEVVSDSDVENPEEILQLLKELLDLELQVAHLARPRNILIKIDQLLKESLEDQA